jgi:hypothetical protein
MMVGAVGVGAAMCVASAVCIVQEILERWPQSERIIESTWRRCVEFLYAAQAAVKFAAHCFLLHAEADEHELLASAERPAQVLCISKNVMILKSMGPDCFGQQHKPTFHGYSALMSY